MTEGSISNASNVFIVLTRDTMIVLGLICVLLYLNWQLSLVVALMFPLLSLLSRYYRNRLKNIIASAQLTIGTLNNVVNEVHQGHQVVKLFGGQQQAAGRFADVNNTIVRLGKKTPQATAARSPFSELIASLALAVVIFIALWQSQNGVTTIGEFMAFIVAMLQMLSPIKNLANISIPMQGMFLASDSVCEFLDQNTEQDTGSKTLNHVSGSLKFENIDVQYSQETRKALDNFNLESQAGERVALVGRSGSGKTTVVNLLPRFVIPSKGNVLIDGENINDLTLANLREQFALVSQDVFLFEGSLKDNVRYSRPNASDEENPCRAQSRQPRRTRCQPSRWLKPTHRRKRQPAIRRATPARFHRPCHPKRCAYFTARRSHQRARQRIRTPCARSPRTPDARAHQHHRCPPPHHH